MLSSDSTTPAQTSPLSPFLFSDTDFARNAAVLHDIFNQLRAEGAQADLDLPRIVVIGNQSAGKSSLIEAISGITVPRDAGTCTRCPMECRLSRSTGTWSCRVSIRWEYDVNGKRLNEVREVPFSHLLEKREDVEPVLRHAQRAVMQHDIGAMYDPDAAPANGTGPEVGFSRNVVCVDLTGPDFVDLSFVDLPGLIQNADSHIVQLVEGLVRSYLGGSSLILVTLPMSDDIENQKAARLAREADPTGSRTIGVLTKPDTIPAGSKERRKQWLDVLEGRRSATRLGYFCVLRPDDDDRIKGITFEAAHNAETKFFEMTAPWSTCVERGRLGTLNLVQTISNLLMQMMRNSLPKLIKEVAQQQKECDKDLKALPPVVTNGPYYVLDLVSAFCSKVKEHVKGSTTCTALVQKNNDIYKEFKVTIGRTAPPFAPYPSANAAPWDISRFVRLGCVPLYLEDIRKRIQASTTRELPYSIPYPAKQSLIRGFLATWEDAILKCFEDVRGVFEKILTDMINQHFERYRNLKAIVDTVVMDLLADYVKKVEVQIGYVVQQESLLYTQNNERLTEQRIKYLTCYKDARKENPGPEPAKSPPFQPNTASQAKSAQKGKFSLQLRFSRAAE